MPDPRSEQGEHVLDLWQGAWIAALITGVIVWGLIFWAIWRYRRRSVDDVPVQTRYNLPMEIFYTIAPILMVIVFFSHTVRTQNAILDEDVQAKADETIEVVGQQWQWTFNYGLGSPDNSADEDLTDRTFPYQRYAYDVGTLSHVPTLVLPEHETVRFNLHSADLIHDFGVPAFGMKMDVIPGRVNHYAVTTEDATATYDPSQPDLLKGDKFRGACYELCGAYHSRMIFRVAIVPASDYKKYVQKIASNGFAADTPVFGGGKSQLKPDQVPAKTEGDHA